MSDTTETIHLKIATPKVDLDPLDRAMAKLTEFDALLEKVARSRKVVIDIGVQGGQLEGAVANFKMLEGLLTAIGKADVAASLSRGGTSIGEIAKASRDELVKLNAEQGKLWTKIREGRQQAGVNEAKAWDMTPNQLKVMKAQTEALAAMEKQYVLTAKAMAGLRTVNGVAEAMTGLPPGGSLPVKAQAPLNVATEQTTKTEEKLSTASTGAEAALSKQAKTAKDKTKTMTDLATATEKTAKADKDSAAAAESNATAQGNLLKQRTRKVPGEVDQVTRTFLDGPGRTSTVNGEVVTEELNTQTAAKQRFDAMKADFARRRAEVQRGSAEMRDLLKQEATAIQKELAGASAGMAGTSMFEQQRGRAAGLQFQAEGMDAKADNAARVALARSQRKDILNEIKAGQIEQAAQEAEAKAAARAAAKTAAEEAKADNAARVALQKSQRKDVLNEIKVRQEEERTALREEAARKKEQAAAAREAETRLTTGVRSELREVNGREAVMRKAILTDEQRIAVLRQLAAAYDQVAGKAGAGGFNPAREAVRGTAVNRAGLMRSEAATIEQTLAAEAARVQAKTAQYRGQMASFGGSAPRVERVSESGRGTVQVTQSEKVADGMKKVITLTERWDAAGKALEPTLQRTERTTASMGRGLTSVGRGFLNNIASVTAWGAAVGALYGTLHVLEAGLASAVKIERQTATLRAVYRGTDAEAVQLRNDVLALAAAEGRSADEAVDAAVRWARLGLTRKEASEAVRVSLVAANVAEISSAEAAEQLSAIYAAYGLEVRDLSTVLDQLNSVSNNLNVTNKALLDGIARTGSVAKQAGVPLAELVGLIGAGVSATGRTGAEFGNAIKSVIVSLSNPEIQNALQGRFGIDVKGPLGELKDMSTLLSEIYVKTQGMNRTEKGEFLQRVGGKQQASRLEALLDSYVTGQVRAIKAQEDLGSAEREGQKIRATTISQWQGMITEMQRMVTLLASMGGETSFLSTLSDGLKSVAFAVAMVNDGLQSGSLGKLLDATGISAAASIGLGQVPGLVKGVAGQADKYNQGRGLTGGYSTLERELAQTQSRRGGAEEAERLFKTVAGSWQKNGFGANALRDATTMSALVPGGQRDAFTRELQGAIERKDVAGATAILMEQQALAAERSAKFSAEETEQRNKLTKEIEAQLATLEKSMDARRAQNLDVSGEEATRTRLEGELAQLRTGASRRVFSDADETPYDALSEVTKQAKRQIGYRMDAAGAFADLPFMRGTESEKEDRELLKLKRQRGAAASTAFGGWTNATGEQANAAVARNLQGEGANGGLLKDLDEKIEAQRQKAKLARFRDSMAEGTRLSDRRMGAYDFGLTETDRLFNTARGGVGMIGDAVARNQGAMGRGENGAREAAEAMQLGVQLNRVQLSLEERRYRIARDIVQARLEENEAASKALVFANREDQLRAALLAKYQQQSGGKAFSNERFAFFDDSTKKAVESFNPDLLPSAARTDRQKTEQEAVRFEQSIGKMREAIDGAIRQAQGVGARTPTVGIGATPPPPPINLPPVTFTFGAELQSILAAIEQSVAAPLRAELDTMRGLLTNAAAGAARSRAQNAGADVILGG